MNILSFLTLLAAILTVYFEYFEPRRLVYFFKPLTLVFTISIVWFCSASKGFYRWAILMGLFFSLVGDTFLIDPRNFIFGLASFLAAHLCYIAAFFAAFERRFNPLSLGAFSIGAVMLWLIYGNVPANLKMPVC